MWGAWGMWGECGVGCVWGVLSTIPTFLVSSHPPLPTPFAQVPVLVSWGSCVSRTPHELCTWLAALHHLMYPPPSLLFANVSPCSHCVPHLGTHPTLASC